jgi:hypothetical protein
MRDHTRSRRRAPRAKDNVTSLHDRVGKRDFFMLFRDVIRSQAFRSLNTAQFRLLFLFAHAYNGRNDGDLSVPFCLARREIGICRKAYYAALNSLESRGLLIKTRQSCGGEHVRTNRYALGILNLNGSWRTWRE